MCNQTSNHTDNSKNKNGFSLMEIMVAISIFVLILLGIIQAFPFGSSIIKASENQTKAAYAAQSKIEELISLGYNDVGVGVIESKQKIGSSSSYLYNFERKTTVYYINEDMTSTNPIDDIGIKTITIKVYYNSALSGNISDYTLNYLMTKR